MSGASTFAALWAASVVSDADADADVYAYSDDDRLKMAVNNSVQAEGPSWSRRSEPSTRNGTRASTPTCTRVV